MRIQTKSNISDVARDWKRLRRSYRKTITSGLNKAAFRVAFEDMPEIMERGIDRPVAFTKKKPAFYKRASENNLRSFVQIKDIQTEYLRYSVFGERGRPNKAVPVKINVNRFGNIPSLRGGKKIRALTARPDVFRATIKGVKGIWQKAGTGIQPLIVFGKGYRYRETFPWFRLTRKAANKQLPKAMNEAINKTLTKEAARAGAFVGRRLS